MHAYLRTFSLSPSSLLYASNSYTRFVAVMKLSAHCPFFEMGHPRALVLGALLVQKCHPRENSSLLLRTLYKKLKQNIGRRAIKRMYGGKHAFFFFLPKS